MLTEGPFRLLWLPPAGLGWLLAALLLGLALAYLPLPMAAGAIAFLAAGLVILIRPLAGLALALILGPLAAWEATFLGNPLSSGQIVFLATLAAWLGQRVVQRRRSWPRPPWLLPLTLFGLISLASLWSALSVWDGIKELGKWVEIGLAVVMVMDMGRPAIRRAWDEGRLPGLVWVLLLTAAGQAALGVWQFAGRGDGPDHFAITERLYRAAGSFQQPNPFGGYLSLHLALSLGLLVGLLAARPAATDPRRRLWLLQVAILGSLSVILGLGCLASWSRGAWLNLAAALAALTLAAPRRRRMGMMLLAVVAVIFWVVWQSQLLPAAVTERLTGFVADFRWGDVRGVDINDANYAVLERLAFWQAAEGMARDHLWLGVGLGNYEAAYPTYALLNWPQPLGHAHNYYLNLLAEVGVIGLGAYLLLWGAIIGQTWAALRLPWPRRGLALGLLAAWVGLAVHHALDNLYVNNLYLHLGAWLGLLACLSRPVASAPPIALSRPEGVA